jgi:Spondin_N
VKSLLPYTLLSSSLIVSLVATSVAKADSVERYEIVVTNITRGQQFTPILAAAHTKDVSLFTRGKPASPELATLAEEGNEEPLRVLLSTNPGVSAVVAGKNLTDPGSSVTLTLDVKRGFDRISLAAMLIPTNDSFFALDSVPLPREVGKVIVSAPAYDSGSERNDELCASIPGPNFRECGGPGGGAAPTGGEEGFVHISAGIHGIGSLLPADRDWRNPVAQVTIQRIR